MSLASSSVKTILTETGDTLICLTENQVKFLVKQNYKVEEQDSILSIKDSIIVVKDEEIVIYKNIINNYKEQLKLSNDKELIYQEQNTILNKEKSKLERKINRQKFFTRILGIAVIIETTVLVIVSGI